MANFQSTILSIAIIMLLLSLIFIGTSLKRSRANQTWPPIIASCPDYWVDLSDNASACFNSKNLGKCSLNLLVHEPLRAPISNTLSICILCSLKNSKGANL